MVAQNRLTDTTATCVAYWKNKESKVFLVKNIKDQKVDSSTQSHLEFSYEAHITVKDSTKDGYTVEWKNENYTSDDPSMSQVNMFFKNLKFIYKTDKNGDFSELVNWEEVRDFYVNLGALSIPKNNDTAQAVWEKTKALFQTREAVENTLIKDVQMFHTFYGGEYPTRKQSAETILPNPFGGQPIPALTTVQVSRLQKNSPTCTVRTTQEIDQGKAGIFIADLLKALGMPEAKTREELEEAFKYFSLRDEAEIELQVKTGWPVSLRFKRVAKMMSTLQTDTYSFTIKQ